MPSLKDLRDRKKSVESTRKITSAMKMVSAAKLKRAQAQVLAARPYAEAMTGILSRVVQDIGTALEKPLPLMVGTGKDDAILLIVVTSDRGLCGGLNGNVARETRGCVQELLRAGKTVQILCVGRKGKELLQRDFGAYIIETRVVAEGPRPTFQDAEYIRHKILMMLENGKFDRCILIFSHFQSPMVQIPTRFPLIPFETNVRNPSEKESQEDKGAGLEAQYIYEPDAEYLLESLLPKNLSIQIYQALLEAFASEQGARMTAMDSATRNAGDMLRRLDLTYNRARQAYITKELIEIISGAEAL